MVLKSDLMPPFGEDPYVTTLRSPIPQNYWGIGGFNFSEFIFVEVATVETFQMHFSEITGLVERVQTLREEIERAIKHLPGELALAIVERGDFSGFNPDSFAQLDYEILDRALDEKIKGIFNHFPDLLYVTLAYCTDENESASMTGINGLVFGFLPQEHRSARIRSIRDLLLGNEENLTARERLAFKSIPVEIPAFAEKLPLEEFEDFEESLEDVSSEFDQNAKSLLKLAEIWFEAYEKYFQHETDSIVRFWRDGVTMSRNVWDKWWFPVT